MRAIIDGENIVSGPLGDEMDHPVTGTQQLVDVTAWPERSPGDPYQKKYCRWDGKKVVKRTDAQIAAIDNAKLNAPIIAELESIDIKSIRSIREYIASKSDCPAKLKEHDAAATAARVKLK